MTIRTADISDADPIRQLHLKAFDDSENELVADLASDLLARSSTPGTLHLVATTEDKIGGHIAFSPVWTSKDRNLAGYILAPLAVEPGAQRTGVGSRLVREGLRRLAKQNVRLVLVYGSPDYYGRFGFTADIAKGFTPPFELSYPFGWQAVDLEGESSAVQSGSIQCVDALNKPELW